MTYLEAEMRVDYAGTPLHSNVLDFIAKQYKCTYSYIVNLFVQEIDFDYNLSIYLQIDKLNLYLPFCLEKCAIQQNVSIGCSTRYFSSIQNLLLSVNKQ